MNKPKYDIDKLRELGREATKDELHEAIRLAYPGASGADKVIIILAVSGLLMLDRLNV